MVFSSIPVYLDPPNWQQQPNPHRPANGSENPQLLAETAQVGSSRLEVALKCPRCESTNTKFCYFNNYSLSQPRHFCKTCRRYWTRGGALRNVPVGGGCSRNKKSKRCRSKSPAATVKLATSAIPSPSSSGTRTTAHLPFMASSLHNLSTRYGALGNMTLNLPQTRADHVGFQIMANINSGSGADSTILSGGGVDHWRLQQFPNFLNSFESSAGSGSGSGSYPFQSESHVEEGAMSSLIGVGGSSRVTTQLPPVKSEDKRGLNSSLSIPENNQYYFTWTDLSGLASSSTCDFSEN